MEIIKESKLIKIIGDNPYEKILADKKNPTYQILVKQKYYQPIFRTYVFKNEKGGFTTICKKEYLSWCHNHIRLIRKVLSKDIFTPTNALTKVGNNYTLRSLNSIAALWREPNYTDLIEELYPQFISWFRDAPSIRVQITLKSAIKYKCFSEKKALKHLYPNLYTDISTKLFPNYSTEAIKNFNKVAKTQPEINLKFRSVINEDSVNPWNIVYITNSAMSLYMDTYNICKAYNVPFKFTWSFKRVKDIHDKLYREYTKLVAATDNTPLKIHTRFLQDWTKYNSKDVQVTLLTSSGELAAEGLLLNHCVASYVNYVNNGECCIVSVNYYNVNYTAEITYNPTFSANKYCFRISQFKGHSNIDAPKEAYDFLENLLKEFETSNFQPINDEEYVFNL
jgi:hypothetical protein